MFVSASTYCFADKSFADACHLIADLEYDKVELWLDENSDQLKPSKVAADPEAFYAQFRETTRLTPVALCLEHDVDIETFTGLSKVAKLLRVLNWTVPCFSSGNSFQRRD